MDDARTKELHRLLERLGRAIQRSVVDSDEVNDCLAVLHAGGWDAVMLLDASLRCREDEGIDLNDGALSIHVGQAKSEAVYRIGSDDARWLAGIGISPTRHRSQPQRALPPLSQPLPPMCDDR